MAALPSAFVSYTHEDSALCERIILPLQNKGLDIWYDRNGMRSGPFLFEAIQDELSHRQALILMMSERSLKSNWVRVEIGAFLDLMSHDPTRIIIPVRISEVEVPPIFGAFVCIDATTLSQQEVLEAIIHALNPAVPLPRHRAIVHDAAQVMPTMPAPVAIPPVRDPRNSFLPDDLIKLGFTPHVLADGTEFVIPPLCEILQGECVLGSDRVTDPQAWNDEIPQHRVSLDGFRIGRFPVTVAEYACFLRAENRRPPQQWDEQLQRSDHPVVYVSWDRACDYATWLAAKTRDAWRLPTEAEWEKAARWDPLTRSPRKYPWGDEWNHKLANTLEGHHRGTTRVGNYPLGMSAFGLLDVCGNVWEWTSSLFNNYPYDPFDGRENPSASAQRVSRGGSWNDDQRNARSVTRKAGSPTETLGSRGFRLAISGLTPFTD